MLYLGMWETHGIAIATSSKMHFLELLFFRVTTRESRSLIKHICTLLEYPRTTPVSTLHATISTAHVNLQWLSIHYIFPQSHLFFDIRVLPIKLPA